MESCIFQNQYCSVEDIKMEEEDDQQPMEIKVEIPHEWDSSLDQKDPEFLNIKEDEERDWIVQEKEEFDGQEKTDTAGFCFNAAVKSEDDEDKPQPPQLQQVKTEDDSETEHPSTNLATWTKSEPGEDCGGPERVGNPAPNGYSESGTCEMASVSSHGVDRDEHLADSESAGVDGDHDVRRRMAPRSGLKGKTAKKSLGVGCFVCDNRFESKTSLQRHMMSHLGKRASSCLEEPKHFKVRKKMVQKGGKRVRCDECGKTFACQNNLRSHMRVHSETFDLEAALKQHMAVHSREKTLNSHPVALSDGHGSGSGPGSSSDVSSVIESLNHGAFLQTSPRSQQLDQNQSGRTSLSRDNCGSEMRNWVDYLRTFALLIQMFVVLQRSSMHQLLMMRRRRRRRQMAVIRAMLKRRVWAYPRAQQWWDDVVPHFNNDAFIRNFRISWESFTYICRRLGPVLERKLTNFRLSIPVQKRIAIALWRLATNSDYQSVSRLFGVGVSTACNCVQEFCHAVINVLLPEHIETPDATKLMEMAAVFDHSWKVPQCVGAIDSNHIPILAPEEFPRDFYNRNGWHSIILQGIVDGKGLFWDVSVGHPGSVYDTAVLRQSHFFMETVNDGQFFSQHTVNIAGHQMGHYIIGDPAYPLQPWLMTPFTDADRLTQEQRNYNTRLNRAWAIVETTFRRLKGRWRCLSKRNDCHLELAKKMALACCVLHNICEERGDRYMEDPPLTEKEQPPVHVLQERQQEGADVRAALVDYFNSD